MFGIGPSTRDVLEHVDTIFLISTSVTGGNVPKASNVLVSSAG